MKKVKNIVFVIFATIFLVGCNGIQPKQSKTVNFLVSSDIIKINDVGFLNKNYNRVSLNGYSSGINTLNLNISKNQICINGTCKKKVAFNEMFFGKKYYSELLEEILQMKPIFNALYLQKTNCGFIQKLVPDNIEYEKCNNTIKFKNGKTKIIIKELN